MTAFKRWVHMDSEEFRQTCKAVSKGGEDFFPKAGGEQWCHRTQSPVLGSLPLSQQRPLPRLNFAVTMG